MADQKPNLTYRSLVDDAWIPAIRSGQEAAKKWLAVADDCQFFYSAACGFQFKKAYTDKAFATPSFSPQFEITLQKGFDVVAIYMPALLAQAPGRKVLPVTRSSIAGEVMRGGGIMPSIDQSLLQLTQQAVMEQQQVDEANSVRAILYQGLLDICSREFPGGGLEMHAMRSILDALILGRGCLWVEGKDLPNGGAIVGSEHDSPRNLIIDPNAKTLEDAQWIARRRVEPVWKVARRFGMSEKEFKRARTLQENKEGGNFRPQGDQNRKLRTDSPACNVVWYEVFSKCGPGRRVMDKQTDTAKALDEVVGDYAYICVCEGIRYPLNANPDVLLQGTDEDAVNAFAWPVPTWLDNEWPVSTFELYEEIDSPYPVTLMQNGLGLLKLVNIILCMIAEKSWGGAKDVMFASDAYADAIRKAVKTVDREVLKVVGIRSPSGAAEDLAKAIFTYKPTGIDPNIWGLVDMILGEFNKSVGLTSLLYGGEGGSQSRSSTDAQTKRDALNTRPQHYQARAERFLQKAANKEKLAARWLLSPEDVGKLMTRSEQMLWDELVTREPVELSLRELDVEIQPGSMKQRNINRQQDALNQAMPFLVAELSKHSDVTGDTAPINELVSRFLTSLELPVDGLEMGPRVPAIMEEPQPTGEQDAA